MQGILITAYKDINELTCLLDTLYNNFKIYLHIDKKSELDESVIKKKYPRVNIVKKYKINWGGINHLKAILELLSMAIQDSEITYIHIISGQDFPTKNLKDFYNAFDNSKKIYMSCIGEDEFPNEIKNRLSFYVLNSNWNSKNQIVRFFNCLTNIIQKILKIKRRSLGKFTLIYKGMVWISLPKDAACYIIDYIKKDPKYISDLEHTLIPEEFFFQTILVNSIYKK